MRLREVMGRADAADVEIAALAYDARRTGPGALFFCVPGLARDGHDFAPEAVRRGAAALVVERPLGLGVPEVRVGSARAAMAPAAARFNGDPSARLDVVGVTGTNGKTTTAFLVRELLQAAGRRCALLGTVKAVIGGRERPVERTTAEAIDLQADLRAMLDAGDAACAMEVSSHALALRRADAVHYRAAVFTNLTQDHLDFHPTMDDYFDAKRRLFELCEGARAINVDDPYGRRLAAEYPDAISFAVDHDADVRAEAVRIAFGGSSFRVGGLEVEIPLPGRFNVSNALAALAVARALGVPDEVSLGALRGAARVPGRFEPVDEGQPFAVLVDYAHTPDSLENVLRAARSLAAGRVISVFGCGGDRDRGKRPRMGAISARLADVTLVTSDNPRSEDPAAIVADILAGVQREHAAGVEVIIDRRAAIAAAIERAAAGDVVVIAGKGHESGQELAGGRKLPFDDVEVAREALRAAAAAR